VLAQFEVLWPDVQGTEPGWLYDSRLRVGLYPTYVLLDGWRREVARTKGAVDLVEEVKRPQGFHIETSVGHTKPPRISEVASELIGRKGN
jgi:hypothetical protein